MKKTLSEEAENSELNLKTNGGLGCSQEQEDSVVEFEMDLNDVNISLDKSSTLTVLVVSLVNKIDLEQSERGQDQCIGSSELPSSSDLPPSSSGRPPSFIKEDQKRREAQMNLRDSKTRQRETSDQEITDEEQESMNKQQRKKAAENKGHVLYSLSFVFCCLSTSKTKDKEQRAMLHIFFNA